MTPREASWWIAVEGQAYGPYRVGRLREFVQEGRLASGSLVAIEADGPYGPAGAEPDLRELFAERRQGPAARAMPTPGASRAASPNPGREPAGPPRVLIVVAEVAQTAPETFAQSLASLGEVVRAGPGAWFLRSAVSATALRNLLSRGLQFGERLIVAEVRSAETAWFALDGEVDRSVRKLWEKSSDA